MDEKYQHPEQRNLTKKLYKTESARSKVADKCLEEYEADVTSCVEYLQMQAEWLEIYFQRHATSVPFEGASEESVPMLFEACSHFHARAMKALFRSDSMIKVIPTEHIDPISKERAHRLTQHMRYTVFRRIKHYKKSKDTMLQALPLRGSMFTKIYPDPFYGFIRIKNLRPHELILPYSTGPMEMEDIPRKTERHIIPLNHASNLVKSGFFIELPEPYKGSSYRHGLTEVDEAIKDIFGFDENYTTDDYCMVLEQRRFLDVFENGWPVPVVCWVDPVGGKLLRLTIGYEVDEEGTPVDPYASPTEPYTHYQYMPNPDGTYGLGHGIILGDLNVAVNRMLRTTIDAAILSTVSGLSGFVDSKSTAGKGEVKLKLGSFTPVPNIENTQKAFWTPDFPGPNQTLISIMEWLSSRGDRAAMVTDLVTGQSEKVMQPTAVSQLLAQTDTMFSSAQDRVMEAWETELRNIYTFNRKFLPPEEYFTAMDIDTGDQEMMQIASEDYRDDYQVMPVLDRASSSQERIALAEGILGATQYFPEMMFMPARKREICRKYLDALGVTPLEEVLPTPDEWMQATMMMMQAQGAETEAEMEMQDDKQEHSTKENEKDRKSEEKIVKMEIEGKHKDEKLKAEAAKESAKSLARRPASVSK